MVPSYGPLKGDPFLFTPYIYMVTPPPLRQTLELHFQSVQEGGGRPTLQNSASFQKSRNPKNPTQVSDFWKLEREPQNPKIEQNPRVSKIPKIQKFQPKFRIFGNSSGSLKIQKSCKFLDFPKFQKSKKFQPKFRIFGNSSGSVKIQKSCKFLEFPKFQTLG